jgi:hypothetical protein
MTEQVCLGGQVNGQRIPCVLLIAPVRESVFGGLLGGLPAGFPATNAVPARGESVRMHCKPKA